MPRVLTFNEMYELRTDQWIWVEVKDHPVGYTNGLYHLQLNRYVSKYHICDTMDECLTISTRELHGTILFDTCEQGWRIWSDKPTQEQMDNTEWDYSTWQGMHRCADCALYVAEEDICDNGLSKVSLWYDSIDHYWICNSFRPIKE